MSGTDMSDPAVHADASGLEAELDGELATLQARTAGDGTHVRNPVFRHEQEAGSAVAADEATGTAVRVAGEMAAEGDQERLAIERQVAAIEQSTPGGASASDAEAALVQANRDADEAVAESLDSDEAAEDAQEATGSSVLHRGADGTRGRRDVARALQDESVVARDLADLDALERRVAGDTATAALPPD